MAGGEARGGFAGEKAVPPSGDRVFVRFDDFFDEPSRVEGECGVELLSC